MTPAPRNSEPAITGGAWSVRCKAGALRGGLGPSAQRPFVAAMLWATALAALLALPAEQFPRAPLALFALPGAVLLARSKVRRDARWRRHGRVALLLLALAMLPLAVVIMLGSAEHRRLEATLTSLLLAPLAFTTLRRRPLDRLLSLFLSFCLLLIGTLLAPRAPTTQILAFAVSAALLLQGDARDLACRARNALHLAPAPRRARLADRTTVTLACLFAALGVLELLRVTPALLSRARAPANAHARSSGLSATFDLRAGRGAPLHLSADELVRVRPRHAATVTRGIYLRSGYFDVAGIDRWSVDATHGRSLEQRRDWTLRPPARGVAVQGLTITRLGACAGLVFVPPSTHRIASDVRFAGARELDWFQQVGARDGVTYTVDYQDLRSLVHRASADERFAALRALPRELQRRELRELAQSLAPEARGAAALALALTRGLQRRCAYALEEPSGPHAHALDNFLFGARRGFCMHFASALAVLLRLRGVPCRIATGLYGGTPTGNDAELAFGSQHAHAWVEVPFRELGWVVFDPTPPTNLAANDQLWPGFDQPVPAAQPRADAAADHDATSPGRSALFALPELPLRELWPWLALGVLLAVALLRPLRRRCIADDAGGAPRACASARRLLQAILQALVRHGCPRRMGQTLEQYLTALAGHAIDPSPVRAAFAAYQEVRFGGRPFDGERERTMRDALAALTRD